MRRNVSNKANNVTYSYIPFELPAANMMSRRFRDCKTEKYC